MQPGSTDPQATLHPAAAPTTPAGMLAAAPATTPEGEVELVRKLSADFERDERDEKTRQVDFERWRQYQRGMQPGEKRPDGTTGAATPFAVQVNLVQATSQVLTSRLYARNPEVSIAPAESVTPGRYQAVRGFGQTAEIMLNHDWRRAGLKRRMRKCVRATQTVGYSWLKAAMQIDQATDPVMQQRINDLTDNLAEIDRKLEELREAGTGDADYCSAVLMKEELEIEMKAAQAKLEVEHARGLVLANRRPEDVIVSGELRELEDYRYANAITDRTWWRKTDVAATFGIDGERLARATTYQLRGDAAAPSRVDPHSDGDWVAVLEKWDRKAGVVHTWVHGCDFLLKPSAPPNPAADRFYPFFLLAWNWLDDTRAPQSDVAQWAPLQDEYNATRSMQRTHRKRSIPATVVNGAIVGPTDVDRLNQRDVNETIALQGVDPQIPVGNLVAELANARMDPAVYDVKPILYDLDVVSGAQEAARAAIKSPKTATEAEIQDTSLQGRTGVRIDEIEEFLGDLATYCLELQLQAYTVEDAIRIAGPGAIWPSFTIEELHQLCTIEIRPGTTGKPDSTRKQQAWGVLLPVIQPIIERIHLLRRQAAGGQPMPAPGAPAVPGAPGPGPAGAPGANPMAALMGAIGGAQMTTPPDPWAGMLADALEELLKETLARADERIDVDRFLPQAPQQAEQPQPMQPPAAPAALPAAAPAAVPAL